MNLTDISARQKIIDAVYCLAKGYLNDIYGCAFCKYYRGKIREGQDWCIVCSFGKRENNSNEKISS